MLIEVLFFKISKLSKLALSHIVSFAGMAGLALILLHPELQDAPSVWLIEFWLFLSLFFIGPLILGVGGSLHSGVSLSCYLFKNEDLNVPEIREKICMLVFFTGEICISILFYAYMVASDNKWIRVFDTLNLCRN